MFEYLPQWMLSLAKKIYPPSYPFDKVYSFVESFDKFDANITNVPI